MAVVPEERSAFRQRFRTASGVGCSEFLCQTPISVVAEAFGCKPFRLRSAADMFPESGLQSEFLNEFYVMDVILNRAPSPATLSNGCGEAGERGGGRSSDVNFDEVRHVLSRKPEDVGPEMDYFYRAAVLFLPQCGVFYCHRDRHVGDAGVRGTLRAYDMSWLRLRRAEGTSDDFPSYTFGSDSFVRRFYSESRGNPEPYGPSHLAQFRYLSENRRVSAWRISTGYRHCSLQNRVVYRAVQCHDAELPMLPPDFIAGVDLRNVPPDYRAYEFRNQLKTSSSAKFDCRHYVDGSHHYHIPDSCWVIDPDETHFVDIHVGVVGIPDRESVVLVRNVTKIDAHDDHLELLERLTSRCREIRVSGAKGTARAKSADVGSMFALGTRIETMESPTGPPVYSKIPYAANACVVDGVLRGLIVDLAILGGRCFPQVYSVVRDTEGNSGLSPLSPMDGVVLPMVDGLGGDGHIVDCDNDKDNNNDDDEGDGDVDFGVVNDDCGNVRENLRERMEMLERRQRVGYTVDMSINLGNSSHFDVNDASQGFSLWTEEVPGCGENWYFVLPNVHGLRPDGRTKFRGMAVKLGHGVAISWDGRVIRHCSSVSCPDGKEFGFVTRGRDSSFRNHLYGTFTAAKEKIVKAGRALCAAGYCPPGATSPAGSKRAGRKRQNKRRRRPRRRGRPRVETGGAAATKPGWQAGELASAEAAVELLAIGLPLCSEGSDAVRRFHSGKRERDVGDSPSPADGREDGAVGGGGGELHSGSRKPNVAVSAGTPCVGGRKVDGQPAGDSLTFGGWRVQITDLEVGGRYKIPKKKNKHVQL
ncbi:hypothetical protein MHU86_19382 [Fragilaria crotonensis]|nr:hypothetical protein MHU86_19382 [Fragilaria crotonensis]